MNTMPASHAHANLSRDVVVMEAAKKPPLEAAFDLCLQKTRRNIEALADDRPKSGDWVLIHVGYAMSKISEQDAADQMRTLEMLGECEAAMEEVKGYGLEEEETKPVTRGSVNS